MSLGQRQQAPRGVLQIPPAEAAAVFFGGDAAVCEAAERKVDALVRRWLLWFSAECAEPPSTFRLDFLVAWPGAGEAAEVWTCEVTECGASLCNLEVGARNAAALNFALRHERSTGRFPTPLPELRFRAQ